MLSPIKIMMAEDHRLFREMLVSALEQYNIFTICEASNGGEVLQMIERKKPELLLLDVEMPEINGYTLMHKIQVKFAQLKVVVLTGHDLDILRDEFFRLGARAYLTKDSRPEQVADTIRQVQDGTYKLPVYKNRVGAMASPVFSRREMELLPLLVEGKTNKEIAEHLHVGEKAIEAHKKNMFRKTKTQNAVAFVSHILRRGFKFFG